MSMVVLLIGAVVVGVLTPVGAAIGDLMRAGRTNTADNPTTVKGASTAILKLVQQNPTGKPIKLKGPGAGNKVKWLNADELDGLDSRDFLRATGTQRMTVPAAAFIPTQDDWDYINNGYFLEADTSSEFVAPLSFPVDNVRIDRVIMRAYDFNGIEEGCFGLYRTLPGHGTEVFMGGACTSGFSEEDPQTVIDNTISPNWSRGWYGLYLSARVPGFDYRLYGVTIEWTPL
jgi:hypothetical protein